MARIQIINQEFPNNISLSIKREDELHPIISGNKFRKLKYNIEEAKNLSKKKILTFGGAFSNHILAVAGAGKEFGFETIGIIRGEELSGKISENPTLKLAEQLGMKFDFVSRTTYRLKETKSFIAELKEKFGDFYLLPEGGTNSLAVKGCEEIVSNLDLEYTHICSAVGTGGTISGIINGSKNKHKIIGFSSLKGDFLQKDIAKFANKENWLINCNYHFGGYGKVTDELIHFINKFYLEQQIPLDPVYTGKMMFGILDLIHNNYFPANSKILAIHTGGLQGIVGMNKALEKKGKTTLII
ncbi:1-aminocyclopropane-1-carboxylate deaminase/D-cysteine desulfhydrase [Flavobacterium difficile]|uniref:1-aminocyclopropane-1-carboxylate deaminase/D-cysteine desulfhydrase n=1 Tax=Flavobacterium difficile TaxID=2709659 RepID=A0ABX0I5U5_9FLAO|nr:pyridoxal-phosphate dependent enzyme [Flavobacterium difficile]NHM00841.1 1-aminocyclopropane-1-carboxylate deaminase/D-cysteine desulfhydrase [Flavobacterium difficile]